MRHVMAQKSDEVRFSSETGTIEEWTSVNNQQ